MPVAPTPATYRPALTGLRAVAVGIVLVQHWVRPAFPLGELGPSLFFVLSGYLISGIIWQSGAMPGAPGPWLRRMGTFYLRRLLRIGPCYYLALVGCVLLPLAAVREHFAWFLLWGGNFFIYHARGWPDGIGHLWTIAVEAQFYLLWPWVLGLLGPRRKPLLVIVALSWLFRIGWSGWASPDMVHLLLPASLDLFALGAVLRLGPERGWPGHLARGRYVLLAWVGWGVLRVAAGAGPWGQVAALSQHLWLAIACFVTIGWLLRDGAGSRRLGLGHPAMQWVGQRSYSIYLYHLPLFVFWQRLVYHFVPGAAGRAFWMGPLPTLLVLAPVLAGLAAASWHFVEEPVDRFKNRFQYRKSRNAVPFVP